MAAATGAITPGRSARRRANPSSRRRSKPASTSSTPPTVIRSATAKRSSVAQSRTLPAATRLSSPPRYTDACPQPARQPEAVPTSFEGQCNPRDLAAGLDRLVTPAMQQAKQPFCTRLQLLAWLALNAGKHTGNQPTRLAHLDDGNDRAILVQGDEGPAQVVRLGHQGTPSVGYSDDGAISSPPAPYHLSPGGRRIRTVSPARGERVSFGDKPTQIPKAMSWQTNGRRRLPAQDYDETAEDLEIGASEIRPPELLPEGKRPR